MIAEYSPELASRVADALKNAGSILGLALELDEGGGAYCEHDAGWEIGFMLAGDDQLVIAISVVQGAAPPPERLARVLIDFNWLGGELRGAALSYNPSNASFLIWRSFHADGLTGSAVASELGRLLESAAAAEPLLREALSTETTTETPATATSTIGRMV